MLVQLHGRVFESLRRYPETGMGYQVVEVKIPSHLLSRPQIILNGDRLYVPDESPDLRILSTNKQRAKAALTDALEAENFRVLTKAESRTRGLIRVAEGGADQAPVEDSERGEKFMRFSAFENDRRINEDGSVAEGTYVTTREDGIQVETGTEAVSRYALPNPEPAVHRFHLAPPGSIKVQRGIVQPNFGQPGGGIEVIFSNGAPAGTKQSQDTIPR